MKKITLLLSVLFSIHSVAQVVAVNDSFSIDVDESLHITRTMLNVNDQNPNNDPMIIDTVIYNGVGSMDATYYEGSAFWVRFKDLDFIPSPGWHGMDSMLYVVRDSDGVDTAKIYITVKVLDKYYVDKNNIKALIENYVLFQDRGLSIGGFYVPKPTSQNQHLYTSIYSANLWVAGKNESDNLHSYSPMFAQFATGSPAGPIMDSQYYQTYDPHWDRLWKVDIDHINYHLANYQNPGYIMAEVIENWPAHGDTSKGQAFYLAPFVDVDNNGMYNPENGDYPKIKGQQAVYFINNDLRHPYSNADNPLGVEIHGMAYAYDCLEDSALNNTLFLNYRLINRSNHNYDDMYAGMWTDGDLGGPSDDVVATDVARGSYYYYNGDNFDEDDNGWPGYGNFLPAQSVTYLKGPNLINDGIDNPLTNNIQDAIDSSGVPYDGIGYGYGDGIIDNEKLGLSKFIRHNIGTVINGNGDPENAIDYYNYLKGEWLQNTGSIVWGGDGNPSGSGETPHTISDFMYTEYSDPLNWATRGVTPPSTPWMGGTGIQYFDQRGVGSYGPFSFESGEEIELDFAFVFGIDYTSPNDPMAGVAVMQQRIDDVRSYFFGEQQTACGTLLAVKENVFKEENNMLEVFPNPFVNEFSLNLKANEIGGVLKVFDAFGKMLFTEKVSTPNQRIEMGNYPAGVYLVEYVTKEAKMNQKIVKQ